MLKNRCVRCDHVIEAPEEQRGTVVVCPRCEATNVLRSPEDEAVDTERERGEFLRRLGGGGTAADAGGWLAPVEAGAHSSDLVLLAGRRLKDVSDYLLVFAYGLLAVATGGGVLVAVWGGLPRVWAATAFLAAVFLGALVFVTFKFMSDAARALADLGALGRAVEARLSRVEQALQGSVVEEVNERAPAASASSSGDSSGGRAG